MIRGLLTKKIVFADRKVTISEMTMKEWDEFIEFLKEMGITSLESLTSTLTDIEWFMNNLKDTDKIFKFLELAIGKDVMSDILKKHTFDDIPTRHIYEAGKVFFSLNESVFTDIKVSLMNLIVSALKNQITASMDSLTKSETNKTS